jgi:RNA polymerase sigma-70 factor (ECF subfamily)
MDAAHSLARYLTRDPVAAEDVVQEAFLNAFRGFDGWRGGAPKAWLLTIVRNCFLARSRSSAALTPIDEAGDLAQDDPTPEDILISRHEAESLRREIEALPPAFREIVVLRELDGLSYKEIATIIDAPIGTVMSRLARARQLLGIRLVTPPSLVAGDLA